MREFNIREFVGKARSSWPCGDSEIFRLIFDDKSVVEATTPRLELSSKLWGPLVEFDKSPVTSEHYLAKGPLSWKSIENVLTGLNKSILFAYGEWDVDRERVWKAIQDVCDVLYNESIVEYAPYARSINIFHFRRIYDYPAVADHRQALCPKGGQRYPSPGAIDKASKAVVKILKTDPQLASNPIVSNYRAGLVKEDQLLQIILIRGFNTEIDSYIQQTPICGDYYSGIMDPAEMLMDSSLASKAILFQGDPLKQTEYANRKLQFSSAQVDLLITGDCGSTKLGRITVTPSRIKGLDGLFFKHPDTHKLVPMTIDLGQQYMGRELDFRLPIYCKHRDMNCVCSTCYGKLALNIPYGTNIGTLASMRTMSAISQLVLKVKHVEGSVTSDPLIISTAEQEFILSYGNGSEVFLNPNTARHGIKLLVRTTPEMKIINGKRLPVLNRSDVQEHIDPSKHTQFRSLIFQVEEPDKKPERFKVSVSRGARVSYFSNEFLHWFLDQKAVVEDDGFYHLDLSTWAFDQPFLRLPNKHTSMKDFASIAEAFIRSTKDDSSANLGKLKQLNHYHDATEACVDMYDMIEEKMPVHMSHVSVVALSMMASDERKDDYAIPPLDEGARFAKHGKLMNGRSLGALFAYEGGGAELIKIEQYNNRKRRQHLLDYLVHPL